MALPINIDDLLHGHSSIEWERLEFKEGWNPESVLHTLCAFANDFNNLGGGYIIIGVAETNGRPVLPPIGLNADALDKLQKEVLSLGYCLHPNYHPVMEPCVVAGKHILVLRAPGGQNRPYKAPESLAKDNKLFAYYIRKGSSTIRAKHQDEIELMSLAAQIPFDDRLNQTAKIADLKLPLIQAFLRDVGSKLCDEADKLDFIELGQRMGIISGPSEYILPQNVGLMFFNENPDRFFKQTQIDVVEFPEGPGGDTFNEKSFVGPLSQMLRDALLYISKFVVKEYVVKHPDRAEAERFSNYPYAAIEELLVNAVYHRSYEEHEPIEVRVLPEEITITSFPGPDRSINLAQLAQGKLVPRRYRNRRIGDFLKELNLTEGRGTGIPTAIRAMRQNGSPPPRFDTDEERTFFTSTLPIHPRILGGTPQATPQATPQVAPHPQSTGFFERVRILLEFCESPRDRASIQARLGLKDTRNFRERYLRPLLSANLLEMTDVNKPSSPNQKYRTTPTGLDFVRQPGGMNNINVALPAGLQLTMNSLNEDA